MEGQGTGGPDLEPRVRQLEHSVDSLHGDVARVSQAVSGVSAQVSGLAKSLDSLAEKLDAHRTQRPEWGVYVSLAALILAVGAAAFWPVNERVSLIEVQHQYDQQDMQRAIERLEDRVDRLHE